MFFDENFLIGRLAGRQYNASGTGSFQRNPDASVPVSPPIGFPQTDEFYDDGLHTPHQDVPMVMPRTLPGRGTWNDTAFFDPRYPNEMSLGFSRKDIQYRSECDAKDREAFRKMSVRQKRLLNAIEKQKFFRLTKLQLLKPGER